MGVFKIIGSVEKIVSAVLVLENVSIYSELLFGKAAPAIHKWPGRMFGHRHPDFHKSFVAGTVVQIETPVKVADLRRPVKRWIIGQRRHSSGQFFPMHQISRMEYAKTAPVLTKT